MIKSTEFPNYKTSSRENQIPGFARFDFLLGHSSTYLSITLCITRQNFKRQDFGMETHAFEDET